MFVSGAGCVGLFVALFFNRYAPSAAHGYALLGTALAWFGAAFLQTIKPGKVITRDAQAEWRLAFWNSRFAKWFEKLARIGLTRRATPAELTYRPTELAISLAADALFAALPKDQRRELKALPRLLEALQRDAQLMRRTVDDLNGAIDGLGETSAAAQSSALAGAAGQPAADARASLRADLVRRRDDAAARLAAAVSALESIRLNLLRLRAGTGTLAEVTADLTAARALEADLDAQVAGQREVAALLRGARASGTGLTPAHATPP